MAFCFTVGTHDFSSPLPGYEGVTAQCHNCGNWSAHCQTRWPWFTFCFVPVLPLAIHKYQEVACGICSFTQDLKNRPDIQSQQGHQAGPPQGHHQWQGAGPPGGQGGYQYK